MISKLPCWKNLSDQQYAAAVRGLLKQLCSEHKEIIATVLDDWHERLLRRHPSAPPERTKRGTKPVCHAASPEARREFWKTFKNWCTAFYAASARFRQGFLEAVQDFPENAFLPRLPPGVEVQRV